ncbi:leucine---tRNA ligase [Spizellomyces sp. 'palustris']|nr:leucine---tRNA ligase [Spizellomyces sp. 'palustris']
MGHVRVYTIADVIARFKTMQSLQVLHPMGWDAFGLPAENAAIDHGVHPRSWTDSNIKRMKHNMRIMGTSFDWSRELSTCNPSYYRWTQHLFLRLYRAGLVYQKEAVVNWDPVDQTVLANEQVDASGRAERSGALVEKRKLKQWFLRITAFADELLHDLDQLDWPSNVKQLQANWIGRIEGVEVDFTLHSEGAKSPLKKISAFTTNPESIGSSAYIAVGTGHPLISEHHLPGDHVETVQKAALSMSGAHAMQPHLNGVFTGVYAIHPQTSKLLPVYVADYVEADDMARLGNPAYDERDREFADKYGIPHSSTQPSDQDAWEQLVRAGLSRRKIHVRLHPVLSLEPPPILYKLRDWLISRQRYWGTPIPIVHCPTCGAVPVPDDQLPVLLSEGINLSSRGVASSPDVIERSNCECPQCKNANAYRDLDTMDTFVDSAWYWLRYCDPDNTVELASGTLAKTLLPVDVYVGGVEHSIMHLLYARFIGKFLQREGIVDMPNGEPFLRLLTQGMVQGRTYREPGTERYLKKDELDLSAPDRPVIKKTGEEPLVSWEKMSKSKFNGVDPSVIINQHGTDATRLYVLYKAAPQDELAWDDKAVVGMERWLARVWKMAHETVRTPRHGAGNGIGTDLNETQLKVATHTAVEEVTTALTTTYGFHVAIASLIKLTHTIEQFAFVHNEGETSISALEESLSILVRMLAPFAPCIAEELWHVLQKATAEESVFQARWPEVDHDVLKKRSVVCAIMVNGKTRGTIVVPETALSDTALLERLARESNVGATWLVDKKNGQAKIIDRVVVGKAGKSGKGRVISFVLRK